MAAKSKKPAAATEEAAPVEVPSVAAAPAFPKLNYDELAEFGRENISAMIKAQLAFSEGLGQIGKELMAYAKANLEAASRAANALLGAKTIDEVVTLSTQQARANVDTLISRSAKLSEMGVAVANEAMAPLGGRVEAAFAKLTKVPAAA